MKVDELYFSSKEPQLIQWIGQFDQPADVLSSLPQLYASLARQAVYGDLEEGALVAGIVHVGQHSIIQSHSIIRGPAIVGNNVVIGSHSEIRGGCFIGSNCKIGHGCYLCNSIIFD